MDTYSTELKPATIPEPRRTHKVGMKFMVATLVCIGLVAFALLTKMAIIPNYFDIKMLTPFVQEEPSMKK